jgi:hypothetical protein
LAPSSFAARAFASKTLISNINPKLVAAQYAGISSASRRPKYARHVFLLFTMRLALHLRKSEFASAL